MRIRGYAVPYVAGGDPAVGQLHTGTIGIIVESDQDLLTQEVLVDAPAARPHDDWLAWLPWRLRVPEGGVVPSQTASWSPGNDWCVDVKSARKIEELGQGLHIWMDNVSTGDASVIRVDYDLSVGLKLP